MYYEKGPVKNKPGNCLEKSNIKFYSFSPKII